jgi:hypothetical protein
MKYCALLALIIIFFPMTIMAQGTAKVSGIVMDQDNSPIEIANVRVQGKLTGIVTDLKGHYSLTVSSRDSVVIIFSRLGYNQKNEFSEILMEISLLTLCCLIPVTNWGKLQLPILNGKQG